MKAQSQLQLKRINAKFKALKPAEKRVRIAKDILGYIQSEKFKPMSGLYVSFDGLPDYSNSVQDNFDNITCECCAMGACLLSATKYLNKVEMSEVEIAHRKDKWKILKGIFTPKQMLMIETAFECKYDEEGAMRIGKDVFKGEITKEEGKICVDFSRQFDSETSRMIGIMENIVVNKGTFKPQIIEK